MYLERMDNYETLFDEPLLGMCCGDISLQVKQMFTANRSWTWCWNGELIELGLKLPGLKTIYVRWYWWNKLTMREKGSKQRARHGHVKEMHRKLCTTAKQ